MESIKDFINRNKDTYIKHSDVPASLIEKYKSLCTGNSYIPEELIWIWENMGFGIYEDGFLQIVNPDEYEFVFDYTKLYLKPTFIWGVTAQGNLLTWEGNNNWVIAKDEGNRYAFLNIYDLTHDGWGQYIDVFLNILVNDDEDLIDSFGAKNYLKAKHKLPRLNYGQCYGYVPALPLGGKASVKNMQVVDTKSYIHLIGMAVGKIIDYSNDELFPEYFRN